MMVPLAITMKETQSKYKAALLTIMAVSFASVLGSARSAGHNNYDDEAIKAMFQNISKSGSPFLEKMITVANPVSPSPSFKFESDDEPEVRMRVPLVPPFPRGEHSGSSVNEVDDEGSANGNILSGILTSLWPRSRRRAFLARGRICEADPDWFCPQNHTCCQDGPFKCCPMKQAVCCDDESCCYHKFICKVGHKTCERGNDE